MPEIFFNGPAGRIEGRYTPSEDKKAPVVLVLHPHPVYGGTMNNKVVYHTFKKFVDNGFSALRINFRGVGRSQGEFDNGVGELTDAATALDWLQIQNPYSNEFWIAGFSFGSWIGMQLLMRRPEVNNFVAISPPVNKSDFSFLSPCPIPGVIIQGNQDSIVPEPHVADFVDKFLSSSDCDIEYKMIEGADHFFRNKLDDLGDALDDYIKYRLSLTSGSSENDDENRPKPRRGRNRKVMLGDFL